MRKKTCLVKGRSGFTLVEIIMTIAIFIILAAITIPGFSKWLPDYHLKTAARDVFSNMQLAKLEAIKRGGDCTITMNTGSNKYGIDMDDDGAADKTVALADYGSGVTFDSSYATDDTITFTPRGMASFSSGLNKGYAYLTNSRTTATYKVEISRVGSLSIRKL